MNSTQILSTSQITPSEYTNIGLGILLLVSEILPMIKKHKGNGIVDSLLCLLYGSKCCIDNLTATLERTQEKSNEENPTNQV
jgi:hypothetical protein